MNAKGEENRSVRKTRAQIKMSYLELMKKKHCMCISVKDVTEKADINRSTFYYHYQDLTDLLDDVENEILEDVGLAIAGINRENYSPGHHPQHTAVFETLKKYEESCRILMSENGDIKFVHKLIQKIKAGLSEGWSAYCADNTPPLFSMYVTYVAHGILGTFWESLDEGYDGTADDMGHFTGEVTNWIDEMFVKNYLSEGKNK